MKAKVNDFLHMIEAAAPFETAEGFDNVGLLIGHGERDVTKVLVALDATLAVVEEAEKIGAELIITHHPLLFHARKQLVEDDPEARVICRLIRNRMSLISAHTNLDNSQYSGSAACANLLELENIRQEGLLFVGEMKTPCTAGALQRQVCKLIEKDTRLYGDANKEIKKLAICGGAYDEGWVEAKALGADGFITGEVHHHNAIAAVMEDFVILDAGHFGTEAALIQPFSAYLQKCINDVKYNVLVYSSNVHPYGRL